MKKKLIVIIFIAVAGMFVNMSYNNSNKLSNLHLANIEAFASDAEADGAKRVKHDCHFGKTFSKDCGQNVYERTGVGESCIVWENYIPSGDPKGVCYTRN